jgi:hypothetical protein
MLLPTAMTSQGTKERKLEAWRLMPAGGRGAKGRAA